MRKERKERERKLLIKAHSAAVSYHERLCSSLSFLSSLIFTSLLQSAEEAHDDA